MSRVWVGGRLLEGSPQRTPAMTQSGLFFSAPNISFYLTFSGRGRQGFPPEAGELVFLGDISFSERKRELQRNSSKASCPVGTVCLFLFLPGSFTKEFAPCTNLRAIESLVSASQPPAPAFPLWWVTLLWLSTKRFIAERSFELAQELHISGITDHTFETAESLACRHLQVRCEDPRLDAVWEPMPPWWLCLGERVRSPEEFGKWEYGLSRLVQLDMTSISQRMEFYSLLIVSKSQRLGLFAVN